MRARATLALVVLLACGAGAAKAERLVVSLSNHRVQITSSFAGENLVLFGAIEPDAGKTTRKAYDLVVTITGPRTNLLTRRKERVAGIWVNADSREFVRVPSYLAVLSNRPLRDIAAAATLRRMQLGLDNYLLTQRIGPDIGDTVPDDPFRLAFVRLQSEHGLYREQTNALTFLTPEVFRASLTLPSDVPTGTYAIDVKLFAGGDPIAQTTSALEVIKAGLEQYVAEAAVSNGLLYGIATALMALITGWVGSAIFRRD